jgi:hypothetical protein
LASDYCYDVEMKRALKRHDSGQARVIPVILRPVDWKGAPFGKLQALPRDAKPVTTWKVRDEAFKNVAEGIRKAVEEIQRANLPTSQVTAARRKSTTPPVLDRSSGSPSSMPKGVTTSSPRPRQGSSPGKSKKSDPGTRPKSGGSRVRIVDSSGMWVMLHTYFFEASMVRQNSDGTLTVELPSTDAEQDSAIQSFRPPKYGQSGPMAFAHRNDGLIVRVKELEAVSVGEQHHWTVTLQPEDREYGGGTLEASFGTGSRIYSADEIAKMRAGRILLNDPPPRGLDARGFNDLSFLEGFIQGMQAPVKIDHCIIRTVYAAYIDKPSICPQLARLAAIYVLKAGDVVEQVLQLTLGPLKGEKVHVKFRGRRLRKYVNVEPVVIDLEGDCPLS